MMLDDHQVAAGKARAELELRSALQPRRKGSGQSYAIDFFQFDAGYLKRQAESFVGESTGPILAGDLGLLDGGSNPAVFNNAAGGIAEQSSQPENDARHASKPFAASE